jgi:hypothetical protein
MTIFTVTIDLGEEKRQRQAMYRKYIEAALNGARSGYGVTLDWHALDMAFDDVMDIVRGLAPDAALIEDRTAYFENGGYLKLRPDAAIKDGA